MKGVRINEVIYIILMDSAQEKSADTGCCEQLQNLALWAASLNTVQGVTKQAFLPSDTWQWPVWRDPQLQFLGEIHIYMNILQEPISINRLTENKAEPA